MNVCSEKMRLVLTGEIVFFRKINQTDENVQFANFTGEKKTSILPEAFQRSQCTFWLCNWLLLKQIKWIRERRGGGKYKSAENARCFEMSWREIEGEYMNWIDKNNYETYEINVIQKFYSFFLSFCLPAMQFCACFLIVSACFDRSIPVQAAQMGLQLIL